MRVRADCRTWAAATRSVNVVELDELADGVLFSGNRMKYGS